MKAARHKKANVGAAGLSIMPDGVETVYEYAKNGVDENLVVAVFNFEMVDDMTIKEAVI